MGPQHLLAEEGGQRRRMHFLSTPRSGKFRTPMGLGVWGFRFTVAHTSKSRPSTDVQELLGASWVVMTGITIVITHIRGPYNPTENYP